MKRLLMLSVLALSLSSCTLVISDFETEDGRPGNIKAWYCPTYQRSYDFSFQTYGNIQSYEAMLIRKGDAVSLSNAVGTLKIFLSRADSGTFKNTVTVNQNQIGVQGIVVRPEHNIYDLYVRTTSVGGDTSSFFQASSYTADCR